MKLSLSAVLFAAMAVSNVAAAPVAADNGVQANVRRAEAPPPLEHSDDPPSGGAYCGDGDCRKVKSRRDTGGHEDPNHGFQPHGVWCSPGNPDPGCGKVRRWTKDPYENDQGPPSTIGGGAYCGPQGC
ncbi:unnamed protein product [Zymoseptoria tritici ST99CH_1A5]|uniref:Uncharacterized protein n=1 Tax=Zymoseptoria tritici ST99CH_1A5 TaxID=1276529 RepID=A0A1Y6LQC4_ZYMTR|nr:unnamed protein product [Zymoseptoria tritici ST99CH_3D1]SMY25640.1 unnamed protein product [Zymoseptoria tritici ST99CH_1A5]